MSLQTCCSFLTTNLYWKCFLPLHMPWWVNSSSFQVNVRHLYRRSALPYPPVGPVPDSIKATTTGLLTRSPGWQDHTYRPLNSSRGSQHNVKHGCLKIVWWRDRWIWSHIKRLSEIHFILTPAIFIQVFCHHGIIILGHNTLSTNTEGEKIYYFEHLNHVSMNLISHHLPMLSTLQGRFPGIVR